MNDITIDYEKLEKTSQEILELSNDYKKTLEKIAKEVKSIEDENIWLGIDSNIFIESEEKYLPYFENIKKTLDFYGNFLQNANNTYKTLEEDYSKRNIYE